MRKRMIAILAGGVIASLALGGCSSDSSGDGNKKINIAVFSGWDEGVAASELWAAILEEKGYDVELTPASVAPVYAGVSTGDFDLVLDTWLPETHADYIKKYGDDMIDLGAWNTEAKLTMAVNDDAPIKSLDELAANADKFDNRIVGIEPGAGLTRIVQDKVIPGYGLEKMELLTSSTPAMLSELTAAEKSGENIVVTLWSPHWANDKFKIRNLEDPKGLLGEAEGIHSFSRLGFDQDQPEVFGWLKNFKMDSEKLNSLENAMFSGGEKKDYRPAVEKWIKDNQEYVDSLTSKG